MANKEKELKVGCLVMSNYTALVVKDMHFCKDGWISYMTAMYSYTRVTFILTTADGTANNMANYWIRLHIKPISSSSKSRNFVLSMGGNGRSSVGINCSMSFASVLDNSLVLHRACISLNLRC